MIGAPRNARAARDEPSPAAAADRLLDRLHAFTSVACEACNERDVPRLESIVGQRGEVLAELERALAELRAPGPGETVDPSMDLLARRIRAFEVLEAKLVERVRRLRDDVQEALERASRTRMAMAGYRRTAGTLPGNRLPARSL